MAAADWTGYAKISPTTKANAIGIQAQPPQAQRIEYARVKIISSLSGYSSNRAILTWVAAHANISVVALTSKVRRREIVRPRQFATWLLSAELKLSLSQIGRVFAQHHTTILHARNEVPTRIAAGVFPREWMEDALLWMTNPQAIAVVQRGLSNAARVSSVKKRNLKSQRFSDDEDARIVELLCEGLRFVDVAEDINRFRISLYKRLKILRIDPLYAARLAAIILRETHYKELADAQ